MDASDVQGPPWIAVTGVHLDTFEQLLSDMIFLKNVLSDNSRWGCSLRLRALLVVPRQTTSPTPTFQLAWRGTTTARIVVGIGSQLNPKSGTLLFATRTVATIFSLELLSCQGRLSGLSSSTLKFYTLFTS